MKIKAIFFCFMAAIYSAGCDPAKILIVKANSNNSSVTIFGKEQFLPYASLLANRNLIVTVSSNDTLKGHKIKYSYGMGNWPNSAISDLVKNIDSIQISNASGTLHLRNKPEIEEYLKQHRGGYAGSRLTIKAD